MTPAAVVGAALRAYRSHEGQTGLEAADKAGISHPTWRRLEHGQKVRRQSMAAVDGYLGLPEGTTAAAVSDPRLAHVYAQTLAPSPGDTAPGDTALFSAMSTLHAGGSPEHTAAVASSLLELAVALHAEVKAAQRLPDLPDNVEGTLYRLDWVLAREMPMLSKFRYAGDTDIAAILESMPDRAYGDEAS